MGSIATDTIMTDGLPLDLEPIAIVGMGCRWPGAKNQSNDLETPSDLWDFLQAKEDAYRDFPAERLNVDAFYHPESNRPGSFSTRGGCFLKADPRQFDPSFFGISVREATSLDPAQRKLLEVIYEAFESGGATLADLSGSKTGCFVGNFNYDHQLMQFRDTEYPDRYSVTGGGIALLSNRINYVFNLKGPSLTLDTACSSSMYALHLACISIQAGECDSAIVGGANLILSPDCQMFSSFLGAVSNTSMCHTFDAAADGYARADGVGALYVKRLSQAIKDNDPIRAVIRGTAVNANGKTGGITHPDPDGQEAAIRRAYARAGNLDPSLTGYFECHGTGTPVGDPLEVEAVTRVFANGRRRTPLLLGAVKSNLGHCEPVSGIAGIMKSVLALEHSIIPPLRALDKLNPNIDLKDGQLIIPLESTPWPNLPVRIASVNSFGYGGANAHTILEAVDSAAPGFVGVKGKLIESAFKKKNGHGINNGRSQFLLAFSAHDERTLNANIQALKLDKKSWDIKDLAYTLGCRRTKFMSRSFIIATDSDLNSKLELAESTSHRTSGSRQLALGFVFTGQGAQWPRMGFALIKDFPVYLSSIRMLDKVLQSIRYPPNWKFEDLLSDEPKSSRVYTAEISQPIVTAIQIALVDLLHSWNIFPDVSVGHSSGEIGAAYASGRISAAEAIVAAYERGQAVSKNTAKGTMLAVAMSAENAAMLLTDKKGVIIACHNSPESVTLSGEEEQILSIKEALDAQGAFARIVPTGGNAYHSHHMASLGPEYEKSLITSLKSRENRIDESVKLPESAFYSSVSGKNLGEQPIDASYWRKNLESPVLFNQAVTSLVSEHHVDLFLEIGPHTALQGPLRQIAKSLSGTKFPDYIPVLIRNSDNVHDILSTAGSLFCKGYDVNLEQVNAIQILDPKSKQIMTKVGKTIVDLPKYQWQYKQTPLYDENRWAKEWRLRTHMRHDILGSRMPGGNEKEPIWRNLVKQKDLSWLGDHKIGSDCVFPTTAYLSMAMEAATQMSEIKGLDPASISKFSFYNVNISTAIIVPDDDTGVEMLLNLQPVVLNNSSYYSSRYQFRITSVAKAGTKDIFTEHVHGQIQLEFGEQEIPCEPVRLTRVTKPLSATQWYEAFAAIGLNYGPTFQGMSQIRSHIDFPVAESKVNLFPTQGLMLGESRYVIHPAALDSALQIALVAGYRGRASEISKAFMPVAIQNLSIWPAALNGTLVSAWAEATFSGYRGILADVSLVNPTGGQILQANGIELITAEHSMSESSQAISPFARMVWRPDFDSLTTETMSKICKPVPRSSEDVLLPQLDRLALLQTIQFRKEYPEIFEKGSDIPQLKRLLSWMLQKEQLAEENHFPDSQQILSYPFEERAKEIDLLSKSLVSVHGAELRLMCHMYESLPAIYRGEMTGIQAAVQGDLLTEFYRDMKLMHQGNKRLAETISLLAHKNPNLKILEVGAGTGSATREILAALKGNTSHRGYDSYMFTDTTTSFLAAAQESFKDYHGIKYSSFDMELTAKEQGYEADFDLVIASNVVHATSDITNTLTNIRSVLKPGGRIALFEFTQPSLSATMILGTFSDFWKGDSDPNFARTEGPFLTESMWHEVFPQAAYESLDILLPQHPEQNNAAVIVATASGSNKISPNSFSAAISLVYRGEPSPYAMSFAAHLHASGFKVDHVSMSSTEKLFSRRLVFLIEETTALFNDINEEEWLGMKHLILNSDSALWVTRGSLIDGKSPLHAMISGIATALRTEVKSVKFLVVDLELDSPLPPREEFEMLIQLESKAVIWEEHQDREWRVKDGILHISRVQPDDNLNEIAKSKAISKGTTESKTLGSLKGLEVEMAIDKPGVLSSIYFKEISDLTDLPKAGEVDIYVKAAGINNCDMAVAAGRFNNDTLSCECAGTIKNVGADVVDLAPGDRVFALAFASFGTVVRTKAIFCQKMEENDKFEEMAGLPTPLAAAVYGILDCGRLQSGETVLIQSATGGVGIAACQLAKYCGAEIYATVGSETKKKELLAMGFGIQEDHIFGSRDEDTPRKIFAHTKGKGIDVILCSARGELMHEYWNCIATMGRLVEIGRTEVLDNGSLSMSVFRRNATFTSFDWKVMSQTKPGIVARTMTQIKSLLLKGVLTPLPITCFHISQAEEAFKTFSKSTHIGKLVFRYDHGKELLQFRPSLSASSFDVNASYLLVGCLGGLGRSYAQWMVNQGARHLVFLSRSGVKGEECISFIAKLQSLGVHIDVVEGDVADKSDTLRAVAACKEPLKGVVLAALTLHDALFENMTLETFNATVKTRVQGTLNLHDATIAAPLDFFMMWSSWAAAIGIATQSNYMASNAFIDNFARYRLSQNLPATSVALSQVLDVGIVSYFPEYQANLLRNGIYGNNEEEFLQFNDAAISWNPSSSDDLLTTGHLLVGIEPSGLLKTDKKNPLDQMAWYKDSRFLALLQATKHLDLNDGSDGVVVSNDDENETLINRIHAKVARFLFVPKEEIDVSRAISTYGIDSMIAAELRNWIYSAFGVQVSLLNLLSPAMTIEKLTEQISSV